MSVSLYSKTIPSNNSVFSSTGSQAPAQRLQFDSGFASSVYTDSSSTRFTDLFNEVVHVTEEAPSPSLDNTIAKIKRVQRTVRALRKLEDCRESASGKKALQTLSHLEGILVSSKKLESQGTCPLMWEYVKDCLRNRQIQLVKTGTVLGEGNQGQVLEVSYKYRLYALKEFLTNPSQKKELSVSESEAKIGLAFNHPNIAKPLLCNKTITLYEKAECDLFDFISDLRDKKAQMSSNDLLKFFKELAEGYAHMHEKGYINRDVKLENVLVVKNPNGSWSPRISDLGYSCSLDDEAALQRSAGTPLYMPKEVIQSYRKKEIPNEEMLKSADLYALGMIIFFLLRKEDIHSPFVDSANPRGELSEKTGLDEIINFTNLTPEHLEPLLDPNIAQDLDPKGALRNIIYNGLKEEYDERPTMSGIANILSYYLDKSATPNSSS